MGVKKNNIFSFRMTDLNILMCQEIGILNYKKQCVKNLQNILNIALTDHIRRQFPEIPKNAAEKHALIEMLELDHERKRVEKDYFAKVNEYKKIIARNGKSKIKKEFENEIKNII